MKKKLLGLVMSLALISSLGLVSASKSNTADVSVNPYMEVTFNYDTVHFGTIDQGSFGTTVTDTDQADVLNATVDTNADWSLNVTSDGDFGTSWTIDSLSADVKQDSTNFDEQDSTQFGSQGSTITLKTGTVSTTSEGDFTHFYDYWLDVPSDMADGQYTGDFTMNYFNQ